MAKLSTNSNWNIRKYLKIKSSVKGASECYVPSYEEGREREKGGGIFKEEEKNLVDSLLLIWKYKKGTLGNVRK